VLTATVKTQSYPDPNDEDIFMTCAHTGEIIDCNSMANRIYSGGTQEPMIKV